VRQRVVSAATAPMSAIRGRDMPGMSRANYRRELGAFACLPFAIACVDMGVPGVVAQKAFDAPSGVVALLESAPHAAAVTSIFWASLMHGRDRVRFVSATMLGLILCVALAALVPASPLGLTMLVLFVLGARCCFIGMVTGRTELWRSNYPRDARTHATGVFTIVTTIVLVTTTIALGLTLDRAEASGNAVVAYRVFYLAAAAIACLGVVSYSRVRWRGRRAMLDYERAVERRDRPGLRAMWRVLRSDRDYRRYMNAQMVMGVANLAAQAPVVVVVHELFGLPYTTSLVATTIAPKTATVLAIPLWSRLLRRFHIVEFRAIHSWSFVIGNGLVGVAVLTLNLPLLIAARALVGAGLAGGNLAWSLGHHDFAPKDQSNTYMGVHVLLTGIRGAIAPVLGVALLEYVGGWVFVLCAAGGAVGAIMFVRMRRDSARAALDGTTRSGE